MTPVTTVKLFFQVGLWTTKRKNAVHHFIRYIRGVVGRDSMGGGYSLIFFQGTFTLKSHNTEITVGSHMAKVNMLTVGLIQGGTY